MLFLERTNTLNYKTCLVLSWSQSVSLSVLFLVILSLVVSFVWLLFLSFSVPVLFSFCLSECLSCSRTLPFSFSPSLCLSSSLYLFVPLCVSVGFFHSLDQCLSCSLLPLSLSVSLLLCFVWVSWSVSPGIASYPSLLSYSVLLQCVLTLQYVL